MDKKPALAVMIGLGKPKGSGAKASDSSGDMSEHDDDYGEELDAVIDELADAISSGDKDQIKDALKAFKEC